MTTQEIWKDRLVQFMAEWVKAAEVKGQSPMPLSFGALIEDDITVRDALEMATRNSKAQV